MLDPVVTLVVASSMTLLFVAAAAGKLADPRAFRASVRGYSLLPERWLGPIAGLLIVAECAIAAGWLLAPERHLVASASAVLLVVYGAAMAVNLRRGRTDLDCGCSFGAAQRLSWPLVGRNAVLAAGALLAALPATGRALGAADYAVVGAAGLAAVALYLAAQQLIGNAARLAGWRAARGQQ